MEIKDNLKDNESKDIQFNSNVKTVYFTHLSSGQLHREQWIWCNFY